MQLPFEKSRHYSNGRQITPFCRYILRCQNWSLRALARSTNPFMEGSASEVYTFCKETERASVFTLHSLVDTMTVLTDAGPTVLTYNKQTYSHFLFRSATRRPVFIFSSEAAIVWWQFHNFHHQTKGSPTACHKSCVWGFMLLESYFRDIILLIFPTLMLGFSSGDVSAKLTCQLFDLI